MKKERMLKGQRIYVLVEGKTDKEVLDFCLQQFYPELHMEIISFDKPDRAGGASFVTEFIKTVLNRSATEEGVIYIGLLDNDTEGIKTKNSCPNTIKAMTLPDLEEFENYPTISTLKGSKVLPDDINGRAAALAIST